jgi:subtilisin family serine protease
MTKIRKLIWLLLLAHSYNAISQQCYPDKDGLYLYYVNVNGDKVPNDMDKDAFITLLSKTTEATDMKLLSDLIVKVKKSFPTAKTDFLQKSISVYAKNDSIKSLLEVHKDLFNLVEMLCRPKEMLLYQPNDYAIDPFRKSHLDLIKAQQAWDITKGDSRIRIGISDTHIEPTHQDLAGRIAVNLSPNTDPNDPLLSWHGIAVSGCATANTDNSIGLSSIGFNSTIAFVDWNDQEDGVLSLAQTQGVRVINCSWGHCGYLATEDAFYRSIRDDHNVVVTAGAGNNPGQCGENGLLYPAVYESVISVTSIGHQYDVGSTILINGQNIKFNWKDCYLSNADNPASHHHNNTSVDICAPGFNVGSLNINNSYTGAWGTSFAAPQVAGVCALVAAVNPCLTAQEIRDIVINTADPSLYQLAVNQPVIG